MLHRLLPIVFLLLGALVLTPGSSAGQRVVGQWTLQPADPAPELRFGRSVAVAGDVVVVGAPGDTTNGPKAGAVYVFERMSDQWVQTKLVPPDGAPDARFGWKVAIEDGRIAVAAPWAPNPVAGRSGTVYLYEKTGGAWRHELLRVSDPAVEGQIGRGLAMAGGRIVAGAPYDRTVHGDGAGSLVVFEQTADGWSSETLVPAQGSPEAWFGLTVTATADRIAAGAYHTRQASGPEAGAASVFERTAEGTWQERPLAPIVGPARKDHFGRAVALQGARVFVGAEEDDNANGTNAGGVFALRLDRPEASPELIIPPDGAPRSYLGFALATTDRYLAASEDTEVRLFALSDEEATDGAKLSTLMGAALPGGVLALAGDGQRLAVGMPFADGAHPNAGVVMVADVVP
ncbi:MAG: hypothetical protein GVY35_08565 [Bacteroidetes bacterium]|jgi:hypothetical protein|nr:hypothetical protein [Bacteroidota bacterium]